MRLRWRKRLWACPDGDCARRTWSESHPAIRPRACLTERARRQACERVERDGHSVAEVARDLGLGWATVMAAVWDHGSEKVAELGSLEGVRAVGMDEHRWREGPDRFATAFCDLTEGRLVEVVQGRSGAGVREFFSRQAAEDRASVEVVALDPWRGFLGPVRRLLPRAQVVVDRFHLVRLGNQVVTEVPQRTQQEVYGHRGRKGDPLYGIRHTLLRDAERLGDRDRERLETALSDPRGDRWEEVACAWVAKELLRDVYAAGDGRLGERSARLPHHTPHQRDDRSPEPPHRKDSKSRPQVSQLGEPSPEVVAALRSETGHSTNRQGQRPPA
ncbi:MAG: hypothetical protein KatS3mg011_1402 [Acidimicrobiia bacterium]|nr:MAG: hypothetical protein KatS3mg011_1402 [Acidimicrobiia bacterium]